MDYSKFALSCASTYGIMFLTGFCISLLSTNLQCSKTGISISLVQGSIFALGPTIVYALSAFFEFIRNPFSGTFATFGVSEDTSQILGVGYSIMLISWPAMVWMIMQSEKKVCQADLNEMSDFKKKMIAELGEKQRKKEANASKA